jgi:hypothetical protein
MSTERDRMIKLLESKIESIVRNIITEKNFQEPTKKILDKKQYDNIKRGSDNVEKSQSFKRQYKSIQKALSDKKVDATGVMSAGLGINLTDDDAARSHAFKKLHKEKTPDGTGNYEFTPEEVGGIFNALP